MATENPRVWFKSISLENVRSFGEKQTINFTDKEGNATRWNVILGDNGTGKTTVLRSLVTLFTGFGTTNYTYPIIANDYFLRSPKFNPKLELLIQYNGDLISEPFLTIDFVHTLVDSGNDHIDQLRNYNKTHYENFPLYGYGAARRISITSLVNDTSDGIGSLIFDQADLFNAEEWLVQADYISYKNTNLSNRYTLVRELLLRVLRDEITDLRIDTETGVPKVFFKTHYGDVRLHELSLGYKTLIAWMVDFAKGLLDRYPDSPNPLAEPAVCLVDEIDLHLHPKFQRTIIQFLTETFPNTQFIVTAHSPLIVLAAEERPLDANIILLKRDGNQTVVANDPVDVGKWSVDQILNSDLFGYVPPASEPLTELRVERDTLLAKPTLEENEQERLAELDEKIGFIPFGNNQNEIKAETIIQQLANALRSQQDAQ